MTTEELHWWHRKRPRWVPFAAAALVVAVVATFVVITVTREEPEEVVEAYLALLLDRDAQGALAYTDQLSDLDAFPRDLLVPEAMAGDWEVTRLIRRHNEDDDPATVDVTITAADGTAREGRFNLAENADGDWRILNPLVRLGVEQLPADFVELNGITTTAKEFWIFPGSYRAFSSISGAVSAPTYVAVPPSGDGRDEEGDGNSISAEGYLPLFTAGPEQAEIVRTQLAAWLDTCAASGVPNPQGCPFKAGYGGPNRVALADGSEYSTAEVVWKVERYPVVRIKQGQGNFTLVTVSPGVMHVSGEGRPYYGGEASKKFSADCGLPLEGVTLRLSPGGFAISTRDVYSSTCLSPYG